MKKARRYLIISWCMTFIILIMWLLAGVGIFKRQPFTWKTGTRILMREVDGHSYHIIETYYGLGKPVYYDKKQDILIHELNAKFQDELLIRTHCPRIPLTIPPQTTPWWEWWYKQLPGFRLGWILIVLLIIQYAFLIRRSPKKTKSFANPNLSTDSSEIHSDIHKNKIDYKNRMLVKPVIVYVLIGIILLLSAFCVIADYYLVYFKNIPLTQEFIKHNSKIDASFLNLEYLLPSILFFVASVISSVCVVKYIKKVKDLATQSDDISMK